MAREESLKHGFLIRNIDNMIRRTPPHLLNRHNRKPPTESNSSPICQIIGGSNINPTNGSTRNYSQSGLLPTSIGNSSSILQSQTMYTGAVPQDGIRTPWAANHNPLEHMRPLLGERKPHGSNSRTLANQPPHQLSSFYRIAPRTNGNNDWNLSQHQQLAQYHCSQLGRNEQLSLPSYSSQHTSNIDIIDTSRNRATSSSALGMCPRVNNPAQSFLQPPPPSSTVLGKRPTTSNPVRSFFQPLPSNADGMGPQCRLKTEELFSLVQSMGTPEFLATDGVELHDPLYATSTHIPVHGTSASPTPNLVLGLGGNSSGIDKGKSKEVSSYWDLDDMVEMLESMNKRQRKVTRQPVQDLTLGSSDGQGGSKNQINLSSENCD